MDHLERWKMPKDRTWDKKTGEEVKNPAPDRDVLYVPNIPLFFENLKELQKLIQDKPQQYREFSTYATSTGKLVGIAYVVPAGYPLLEAAARIY